MPEFDSVIPAGQSGKLTARISTKANQKGRLSKSISVTTDAPEAATFRLTVSMDVTVAIEMLPSNRIYIQAVAGHGGNQELVLRRADGKALEVTNPINQVGVDLDIELRTVTEERGRSNGTATRPGDVLLEVGVAKDVEPVNHSGVITLQTNDPRAPSLKIPVAIRVRPQLEAQPSEIRLWGDPGATRGRTSGFRLVNNLGESFTIDHVESSSPELFTAGAVGDGAVASAMQTVWVRLAEDCDPAKLALPVTGSVTISLGGDADNTVSVPVIITFGDGRTSKKMQPLVGSPPPPPPAASSGGH